MAAGGQLTHTKERPVRTADKIQKSPASCADRCSLNNCILASAGMAFIWLQRGHHLLLFPLPLSILWGWFPKGKAAKHRRGRSKRAAFEEAPRLADAKRLGTGWCDGVQTAVSPLCAQRGYGGRRRPPCFWWGSRGGGIFAPKIPSPCPVVATTSCGSREELSQ